MKAYDVEIKFSPGPAYGTMQMAETARQAELKAMQEARMMGFNGSYKGIVAREKPLCKAANQEEIVA